MRKIALPIVVLLLLTVNAMAASNLHIVQPGDTLWSLSRSHYKNPFLWGKIWMNNTYLNDPNLIFPGELIRYTKHGIVLYSGSKRKGRVSLSGLMHFVLYDSFVFYDGKYYYSDCGNGFCIWKPKNFRLGHVRFDLYNELEARPHTKVFVYTQRDVGVRYFYVYRQIKDYWYNKVCSSLSLFVPIGLIRVTKKVKPGIYEGVIEKAYAEISGDDIVNTVYPFKAVPKHPKQTKLNNLPVELIGIYDYSLTPHTGYYLFLKVPSASYKWMKKESGKGYHMVKYPPPLLRDIVGRSVTLERVNPNLPVNTAIGTGVVVSQYENYLVLYFNTYNSDLKEIPDKTQHYVLR